LAGIESSDLQASNPAPPPTKFPVYSDFGGPTMPLATVFIADLQANGTSDLSDQSMANRPRYPSPVGKPVPPGSVSVSNTRDVMSILLRIPSNRTLVTNLPPKRILEPPPTASGAVAPPASISSGVVVLDGWSDPIIFVPRGGLHVYIKNPTNPSAPPTEYIVRSSGTFPKAQLPKHPLTASDRPFFASGGQDSDFTTGEDNVYSFQE
jgi:hypothetical protein